MDDLVKFMLMKNQLTIVVLLDILAGGTSVSEALVCPENEHRMIISLDTSQMVKIIFLIVHSTQ